VFTWFCAGLVAAPAVVWLVAGVGLIIASPEALGGPAGLTPDNTKALAQAHAAKGGAQPASLYGTAAPSQVMAPQSVTNTGGSQPHTNLMPYLVLNFIVALQGVFPSRN